MTIKTLTPMQWKQWVIPAGSVVALWDAATEQDFIDAYLAVASTAALTWTEPAADINLDRLAMPLFMGAWADRPLASAVAPGSRILVTDVVPGRIAHMRGDGAWYRPENGSMSLGALGAPVAIQSGGSMGANGALTLTIALDRIYAGGIWLYFPAGKVWTSGGGGGYGANSAAGFYWTVMSSTTAGTVYRNTYAPGSPSTAPPATPLAVVDSGPGAYTQTTSDTVLWQTTIKGGFLAPDFELALGVQVQCVNNAGTKTTSVNYGGSAFGTQANTSIPGHRGTWCLKGLGVAGRQDFITSMLLGTSIVGSAKALDLTADLTVSVSQLIANSATDYAVLTRARLDLAY